MSRPTRHTLVLSFRRIIESLYPKKDQKISERVKEILEIIDDILDADPRERNQRLFEILMNYIGTGRMCTALRIDPAFPPHQDLTRYFEIDAPDAPQNPLIHKEANYLERKVGIYLKEISSTSEPDVHSKFVLSISLWFACPVCLDSEKVGFVDSEVKAGWDRYSRFSIFGRQVVHCENGHVFELERRLNYFDRLS